MPRDEDLGMLVSQAFPACPRHSRGSPRVVDTRPARLCLAEEGPMGQQRRQFSPESKADPVASVR
jgi:hypothetical protein